VQVQVDGPEQGMRLQIVRILEGHEVHSDLAENVAFLETVAHCVYHAFDVEVSEHVLGDDGAARHLWRVQNLVLGVYQCDVPVGFNVKGVGGVAHNRAVG